MDLRIPSGWLFLLLGVILLAVGIIAAPKAPLTDANVNLYVGLAMVVFGGGMLWLARNARS